MYNAMYISTKGEMKMARMVRKQVYIEPRQDSALKERAKLLGVTEADLIRRGIDQVLSAELTQEERLKVWEEMKEYIEKHRSMKVPQTGRSWTRDELYEERLAHHSR
jgi:hypothetical protein